MLHWTIAQTIATCVGLVALILTGAALLTQRYLRQWDKDPGRDAVEAAKVGIFRSRKPSYLQVVRGHRTVLPVVPTVTSLIEAGDLGLWTSATLASIRASPSLAGWVPLFENVVCSISTHIPAPTTTTTAACAGIDLFLARARNKLASGHPLRDRLRFYQPSSTRRLVCCIRRLDSHLLPRIGLGTSRPPDSTAATPASVSVPSASWKPKSDILWLMPPSDSLCVPISAGEVLALAAILSVPLEVNDYTQRVKGTGAFGASLSIGNTTPSRVELSIGRSSGIATTPDLTHGEYGASSGYSTVMAKHIAFGCVPLSENDFWNLAVYVTEGVFEAIRQGRAIADAVEGYGGVAIQYLWQLPAAKDVDAYFHSASGWVEDGSCIGAVQTAGGMPVMLRPWKTLDPHGKTPSYAATWPRAVVGIAFGGLVPQASSLVVDAVSFTIGGTGLSGCLNGLENLLNDLHELDKGPDEEKLAVYGEMVHQRCQMRAWIESLDGTLPMR
jgi:hypothetical protein